MPEIREEEKKAPGTGQTPVEVKETNQPPVSEEKNTSALEAEQYPWMIQVSDDAGPAAILDHHKKVFEQIKKLEGRVLKEVLNTYLSNNIKQLYKTKISGSYRYVTDIFVFSQDMLKDEDSMALAWRGIVQVINCNIKNGSEFEYMLALYIQAHNLIEVFGMIDRKTLREEFFSVCDEVKLAEKIKLELAAVEKKTKEQSNLATEQMKLAGRPVRAEKIISELSVIEAELKPCKKYDESLVKAANSALDLLKGFLLESEEKSVKKCIELFNVILNKYMNLLALEIKDLIDFDMVRSIVEKAVSMMREFECLRRTYPILQYPGVGKWDMFVLVRESYCDWLIVSVYNKIMAAVGRIKNISKEQIINIINGGEKVACSAFGEDVYKLLKKMNEFDNAAVDSKRAAYLQQCIDECFAGFKKSYRIKPTPDWIKALKLELTAIQTELGERALICSGLVVADSKEDFCEVEFFNAPVSALSSISSSNSSEEKKSARSLSVICSGNMGSPVFSSQIQVQSGELVQLSEATELVVVSPTTPTFNE